MFFAQAVPDYSKQLEAIVKAMNGPTSPVWLIALFSAFLGVVGGLVGQLFMMWATDFYGRYKMRRVLYLDLVGMLWAVENIMSVSEGTELERWRWQKEQLRKNLLFRGEKYCSDKPELYMQLPERRAGEMLYPRFHELLDDETWLGVNTGRAKSIFSHVVHDETLKPRYLRLFLGRKGADELRRVTECHYRQNEERLERMGIHNVKPKSNENPDDSRLSE